MKFTVSGFTVFFDNVCNHVPLASVIDWVLEEEAKKSAPDNFFRIFVVQVGDVVQKIVATLYL